MLVTGGRRQSDSGQSVYSELARHMFIDRNFSRNSGSDGANQKRQSFGNCSKCGTVSNKVTTIVDYPDDPEPVIIVSCDLCKALINVSPEGVNYSDLLKRIQPRTSKERTRPSSPTEVKAPLRGSNTAIRRKSWLLG